MSNTRKKRGIKSDVTTNLRPLRPRASRHGRPLSEVFIKPAVFKTERKIVLDPETNQYVTVYEETMVSAARPMTPAQIAEARAAEPSLSAVPPSCVTGA